MLARSSDEKAARPSVKRVNCDKMEERSVQIFIPYERSLSLVFWEEWLVGATPFTWNFGLTGPRLSEIADFEPIFARSTSAITLSQKSAININAAASGRVQLFTFPSRPSGVGSLGHCRYLTPRRVELSCALCRYKQGITCTQS